MQYFVGVELVAQVLMKSYIFGDVRPCSLSKVFAKDVGLIGVGLARCGLCGEPLATSGYGSSGMARVIEC
jgi:hypothetical protein